MNYVDTLLTQYANSPVLCGLLEGLNDALDPSANIEDFYDKVFNLSTAQGYGLDIWGRIIGVKREVPSAISGEKLFGFSETKYFTPFNVAPFNGGGGKNSSYRLPDELYRRLLFIKAYINILHATAPNINKFLFQIFGKYSYYMPLGDMRAQYSFFFTPNQFENMIIYRLKLLPEPCGITVSYKIFSNNDTLGFSGSGLQPFNQGTFYVES